MLQRQLKLKNFRQSKSTTIFKDHYEIVKKFIAETDMTVLKLGRGYPGWDFFRRAEVIEQLLIRDVNQLQGYLSPLGEADTRQALLDFESQFGKYGIHNIAFSAGALTTFNRIAGIIRTKNYRELLIATPNYPQLEETAIRHGKVRLVAAKQENGYNLTAKEIQSKLTEHTSGVLLLNPNVTGIYADSRELGRIIDLLDEKNVFLILDETNDSIAWSSGGVRMGATGRPQVIRPYPDNIDSPCVIRLRSFSKGEMLAEYRIGYVVANPNVITALEQSVGANTPPSSATEAVKWLASTYALWAAGRTEPPIDGMEQSYIDEIQVNSNLIDALRTYVRRHVLQIEGGEVLTPQNSFNMFFRINGYSGIGLFEKLLRDCHVAVNPGPCFGFKDKEGWVRITLANSPDQIQLAMERMVQTFPSSGIYTPFTFDQIQQVRVWENCRINLPDFLPY